MTPRLLHFEISHYNEKVRWALDRKRVPHTREALTPGLHVPRVRLLTGQPQVPVLVLDGAPVVGSATILAELERRHPEPRLFPEDPDELARALAVQRHFDEVVAPDLRRVFWSAYLPLSAELARLVTMGRGGATAALIRAMLPVLRPAFRLNMGASAEGIAKAKAALPGHLDGLARAIGPSGYLVGERFTVADLTAAAVMTAILRPKEFPYPLPEPWPDALVEIREGVVGHPAAQWVLETYRRERDASAEV